MNVSSRAAVARRRRVHVTAATTAPLTVTLAATVALLPGCSHSAPKPKPDVAGFLAAWHQKWPGVPSSADAPLLEKARGVCAEPDASIVAQWRDAQQPDPAGLNELLRFQLLTPLHYLCPAREGLLNQGAAA